jgi:hypothetical protein
LDKKGIEQLLTQLAKTDPEQYRKTLFDLTQLGHKAAYYSGGNSFGLEHLSKSMAGRKAQIELGNEAARIYRDPKLSPKEKELRVVETLLNRSQDLSDKVYKESVADKNPLAEQIKSGARGNPTNLRSLRGSDLLYVDHRNNPIPIPILRSYGEGLSPVEWYSGTFGARKGVVDVKQATANAGFFGKQLFQATHRLIVSDIDNKEDPPTLRGLPVETEDPDNEGALLAKPAGGYPRNTVLTPQILSELRKKKVSRLLIRSPMVGGHEDGGLLARDVGLLETGRLPTKGEFVGGPRAQALSEPLSQGMLSSKHSGGVAGAAKSVSGFPLVNQLAQAPKTFKGGATHAQKDGRVEAIYEAPQGGQYVLIDGERHYIPHGLKSFVKPGSTVEAGDAISEGIPNPAELVFHKGIGEGRKQFTKLFKDAYDDASVFAHRRHIEMLARGLIDHVKLTDEVGENVPGDIVPYSRLEAHYQPREGFEMVAPKRAIGKYLEVPALHYSIGTQVKPSVVKQLEEFGVPSVAVHHEPPPFQPTMIRAVETLQGDPDPFVRMLGSYQQKSLMKGVHRGQTSDEKNLSYVPALMRGIDFHKWPYQKNSSILSGMALTPEEPSIESTPAPDATQQTTAQLLTGPLKPLAEQYLPYVGLPGLFAVSALARSLTGVTNGKQVASVGPGAEGQRLGTTSQRVGG